MIDFPSRPWGPKRFSTVKPQRMNRESHLEAFGRWDRPCGLLAKFRISKLKSFAYGAKSLHVVQSFRTLPRTNWSMYFKLLPILDWRNMKYIVFTGHEFIGWENTLQPLTPGWRKGGNLGSNNNLGNLLITCPFRHYIYNVHLYANQRTVSGHAMTTVLKTNWLYKTNW